MQLTRVPLFCLVNKGLIAGAHSLGYVSCASKKGNTPAGARTHAFDFNNYTVLPCAFNLEATKDEKKARDVRLFYLAIIIQHRR